MLSLPEAVSIGLKLVTAVPVELADGSRKLEYVFEGAVILDEKPASVEIFLTSSSESLIGTGLLQHYKLILDFAKREIEITA